MLEPAISNLWFCSTQAEAAFVLSIHLRASRLLSSKSSSQGISGGKEELGLTDGDNDKLIDGLRLGESEGLREGLKLGESEGDKLLLGLVEGDKEGENDGDKLGLRLGESDELGETLGLRLT